LLITEESFDYLIKELLAEVVKVGNVTLIPSEGLGIVDLIHFNFYYSWHETETFIYKPALPHSDAYQKP
jgi:hypothetical protein